MKHEKLTTKENLSVFRGIEDVFTVHWENVKITLLAYTRLFVAYWVALFGRNTHYSVSYVFFKKYNIIHVIIHLT